MFKTLKIIAAELKRANDLKEKDINNKEMYGWYTRVNPNVTLSNGYPTATTSYPYR
jgi:CRISPR/Cas system CMR-associated protein Cmr5 small subunit